MHEYPANADSLLDILRKLRSPEGCPWDREQTRHSLVRHLDGECAELIYAIDNDDIPNICEELGDVLFAAVKVARFSGVDPEEALSRTCEKFISRFRKVEESVREQGASMEDMPLDELTALWEKAKRS